MDFFKLAVEKLGYSAQEVVHIGNRIDNDVIPAKSIGMRTIWLRRGEANPNPTDSDLKEADLTIETLTGVAEQVFNL